MTQEIAARPPKGRGKGGGRNRQQRGTRRSGPAEPQVRRSTHPWINQQIILASDTGNLNQLVATVEAHLLEMNLVNLSTALHRLARMTQTDYSVQMQLRRTLMPNILVSLREALKRAVYSASPPRSQALSNITWALASMQLPDIQCIELLAKQTTEQLGDFKHFELSTTLWAFAKLGSIDVAVHKYVFPVFATASEYIVACLDKFTFRGLVMTLWAFATARQHDARLFRVVAAHLLPNLHTANCQELANTAWSFTTAGVHKERLFSRIAEEAIPRLAEFKPQELSSILWSFAAIGFCQEAFFEAAAVVVRGMQLQAQQLANILWAFTRARARQPSTQQAVLALLPRCTELIKTFKPQELASVSLAAAKSFGRGVDSQEVDVPTAVPGAVPLVVSTFFYTALPLVAPDLKEYSGQSVANIAHSFLSVHIGLESELFPAVGYEVAMRAEKLENSALLLLLKTLPQAPRSTPVHGAICMLFAEASRRIHSKSLQPREISNLSRICNTLMGNESTSSSMDPNQLLECCSILAQSSGTLPRFMKNAEHLSDLIVDHGSPLDVSLPHGPPAPTFSDKAGQLPSQASVPGGAWYENWSPAMTVGVANTGRPPSAWDAEAMQALTSAFENAAVLRETDVLETPVAPSSSSSWVNESPNTDKSSVPHFVFSVKNTFLELSQDDKSEAGEQEPEVPLPPLPPPLSIIPDSVSPEKLAAYRADYARFRVGNAIGAKGEIEKSTDMS